MDAASLNLADKFWLPHLREASWVAIGQASAAIGGLLALKVSTNVLGPAEFGRFSAVLAIVGIGQVCFFGPVSQAALRFLWTAREHHILGAYRFSLLKLYLAGVLATILCGMISILAGFDHAQMASAILIVMLTIVSGLQMILLAVVNAARLRKWVAGLQIADAIIKPVLILTFAGNSASGVVSAYVITTLIIMPILVGVCANFMSRNQQPTQVPEKKSSYNNLAGQMASFSGLFVLFGVLGAVGSHGERLLLINFVSWEDVGTYALMAQLALTPNVMLTSVINQFYLPLVYQLDSSGSPERGRSYRHYLMFSVVSIFAVAVFVAAFGRWIIPLFSSTAFLGHEHLLWFLALSAGVFNLGQQLVLPGMRDNRLSVYVPSKLLHSLGLLCLALVLAPAWGITGMAVASLVSATIYTLSVIVANAYLARSVAVST